MYTTVSHQACCTLCPSTVTADELGHKLHLPLSFLGWWLWVLLMWLEFEMFQGEYCIHYWWYRLSCFSGLSIFHDIVVVFFYVDYCREYIVYSSHMWLRKSVLQKKTVDQLFFSCLFSEKKTLFHIDNLLCTVYQIPSLNPGKKHYQYWQPTLAVMWLITYSLTSGHFLPAEKKLGLACYHSYHACFYYFHLITSYLIQGCAMDSIYMLSNLNNNVW